MNKKYTIILITAIVCVCHFMACMLLYECAEGTLFENMFAAFAEYFLLSNVVNALLISSALITVIKKPIKRENNKNE